MKNLKKQTVFAVIAILSCLLLFASCVQEPAKVTPTQPPSEASNTEAPETKAPETEAPEQTPEASPTESPTPRPTKAPDVYPVTEQTVDNYTVKIVEFNIQAEGDDSSPIDQRSTLFREFLDIQQPDVVGLQEVSKGWSDYIDEYVFNDSYVGVGEPRDDGGEMNSVYYRKDKFQCVAEGTFWLSETPDEYASKTANANLPRVCTWVTLRDKTTGVEFSVINTHLDHNGDNNGADGRAVRMKQLGYILKGTQSLRGKPLFFTCDLNQRIHNSNGNLFTIQKVIRGEETYTDGSGTEYSIKLGDARIDAKETVPEDRIACQVKFLDESSSSYDPSYEPIDYIFYDPEFAEALTYDGVYFEKDDLMISDHIPLVATFRIIPKE